MFRIGIIDDIKKAGRSLVRKDVLTAPFVAEMKSTTANMYRLGWDERNGGNISYLLDENEVAEYLDLENVVRHSHGVRCARAGRQNIHRYGHG